MSDKTNGTEVSRAFNVLRTALQADDDYAWGWHCNIAMSAVDAGCDRMLANDGAARFMKLCFDVDTSQFPRFRTLVEAA